MSLLGAAAIAAAAAAAGSYFSKRDQAKAAARNAASQEHFARHGLQWKIEDAKKAGISPEFALGASTHSFAPTETGSDRGSIVADAGQNIARSVLATEDKGTRELNEALKAETLRGMRIDNDIKSTQMTSVNKPGNPAFPNPNFSNLVPGQAQSPVVDKALERTGQHPSARHSEGASIPSVGWAETDDGGLMPIPSQDIKNRIEDQAIPEAVWAARHLVGPNFGKGTKPPSSALPKGAIGWRWSMSRQAWYPQLKPKMDSKHMRNWIPENRFQNK